MSNSKIKTFLNKIRENIYIYWINFKNEIIDQFFQIIILLISPFIYLYFFNKDSSVYDLKSLILELSKYYIPNEEKLYLLLHSYTIAAIIAIILSLVIFFFPSIKKFFISPIKNKENSKNKEDSKNEEVSAKKRNVPISTLTVIKKILSNCLNLGSILLVSDIYITILYIMLNNKILFSNEIKESDVIKLGNLIKPFWLITVFWLIVFLILKIVLNVYIEKRTNELKSKSSSQNIPDTKDTNIVEVSVTTPLEDVIRQLKLPNSKKQETIADLITHSFDWVNDEYEVKLKDPENLKIELILVPKQSDTNQPQNSVEKTKNIS